MNSAQFISLLTHTEAPADPAAIRSFEELAGSNLSTEYRDFLSLTNGGFLPPGGFPNLLVFLNLKAPPKGPEHDATPEQGPYPQDYRRCAAAVGSVFGLRELVWHFENLGVPLPTDLIAIMDDGSGNLFCLGVSGPSYGKIHFRDGGEIYLLADSFSEFLSGLRYWDEVHPKDT
jgi:hypothetical protein